MDVLFKFVDCEASHQWLFEANLLTHLIALLHKDEPMEVKTHKLLNNYYLIYKKIMLTLFFFILFTKSRHKKMLLMFLLVFFHYVKLGLNLY